MLWNGIRRQSPGSQLFHGEQQNYGAVGHIAVWLNGLLLVVRHSTHRIVQEQSVKVKSVLDVRLLER